jgi:drug/metabolite transporter (DMT)-like permease
MRAMNHYDRDLLACSGRIGACVGGSIRCPVVAALRLIGNIAPSISTAKAMAVGKWVGVLIGILSSCLGGTAAAVTRYLVGGADALTLAILRWGIGFACVLPVALLLRVRWPARKDWLGVATLGIAFFGLFFILYNVAISYTTAARASLALSTLPLQTMLVGALLGIEPLTLRKSFGVGIAVLGVFAALASGLAAAPAGAWRGELIMAAAVLCMAFYNVWSRPFMQRSSALGFLTVGMGFGAAALIAVGLLSDRMAVLARFDPSQWVAGVYLGVGGGALAFILWVLALQRATPTRVANTMTVNPVAAALLAAALVGEPITLNLVIGLIAVFAGIWIATSEMVVLPGVVASMDTPDRQP